MTQIGSVYGEALYELACSEGLDKAILDELTVLDDSFRGKVNQYLLNFLKILTEKGYMHHFTHCCEAYTRHYNEDHNILSVRAVTAVPLTDKQAQALTQKLTRMTGKTILLDNRVDATCLGGVRLDYDGRRLDDTICHRMESIRELLKNTVL